MDDRSEQGSRHCSQILGLSATGRRVTEAHNKPRDSIGHLETITSAVPLLQAHKGYY